jgi:4'-phosphopantetheinyl transferase
MYIQASEPIAKASVSFFSPNTYFLKTVFAQELTQMDIGVKKEPSLQTVRVWYTVIPDDYAEAKVLWLVDQLPISEQAVYVSISKPLARIQFLLGRLLIRALCTECFPGEPVSLHLSPFGKPYLSQKPLTGISIAHSDHLVVCALQPDGPIGIDAEFIRPIVLNSFESFFLPTEWDFILAHPAPLRAFFDLWTRKEAVVKADGRGLGLDLCNIETLSNPIRTELDCWCCSPIYINEQFACTIAYLHRQRDITVHLRQVDIAAF